MTAMIALTAASVFDAVGAAVAAVVIAAGYPDEH